MSNQNINGYEIERFSIGDDDYFDIDWLDGAVYKTAKVKGNVIKALASGVNIYNTDGTLTGDRTLNGDSFALAFQNLRNLLFDVDPAPSGTTGVEFNVFPSGALMKFRDSSTNEIRLEIMQDGTIRFNDEYSFPLLDGNAGDVLTSDGSGNVTFQPIPVAANIYNSDGALTGNRIANGSFFDLFFLDHNSFIFQTSANGTDTQNGVWFDIDETNILGGGNLFRIRKKGGVGIGRDRFRVLKNGQIEFNENFRFPLVDGLNGQVLQTDGSGNLTWNTINDVNIYNSDGTITGTRTIDGNNNFLTFTNISNLRFNTQGVPFGVSGFEINANPTGNLFTIKNALTNVIVLKVAQNSVTINNEYTLPTTDGSAGQVMQTDGSGIVSWQTPSGSGDMLKSVYDPDNDGIVNASRREMVSFINKTGATLTKGTIVYLKTSSVSGTHPEALKSNAATESTSSKTIGAVFEDTSNDAIGYIVTSGEVDNLDTSAYSIGDRLWLSTTDGLVQTTPPVSPNHAVFIGIVTRSQNVNGRILYAIQNGYELNELHDVSETLPTNNQILRWNATTNLWEPSNETFTEPFIPDLKQTDVRRGVIAISGSTNQGSFGGLTPINTGTIVAVAMNLGDPTPYPKHRLLTTTGTTNSVVGIVFGNSGVVHRVGWGFRFVGVYSITDRSSGGTEWFVPNARHFCGLSVSSAILPISSTTTLESQTNIIGIGSDASDVNLQLFHNDGTGTATKIDLGASFPANKSGAVTNQESYRLELFNEFASPEVKYRVTKLSNDTQIVGSISGNIPIGFMQPQIVRTSGSTSQNVSLDITQLTAYTPN